MIAQNIRAYTAYRIRASVKTISGFLDCGFVRFVLTRFSITVIFSFLSFFTFLIFARFFESKFIHHEQGSSMGTFHDVWNVIGVPFFVFLLLCLEFIFLSNSVQYAKHIDEKERTIRLILTSDSGTEPWKARGIKSFCPSYEIIYYFIMYAALQMTFFYLIWSSPAGGRFWNYSFGFLATLYFMSVPSKKKIYAFFFPLVWGFIILLAYYILVKNGLVLM